MNSSKTEIIDELVSIGHNKQDIINSLSDADIRLSWDINSFCSIYSRRNRTWYNGQIIDIFINRQTNQEWLTAKYNKKSKKQIQRFNGNIKPINSDYNYNPDILTFIAKKLKENEQIDLSIFEKKENGILIHQNEYTKCPIIHRLLTALKYYSALNIIHNHKHYDIFAHFVNDTYHYVLDDNIHLINKHNHQLQDINQELQFIKKCDISSCAFALRHHQLPINIHIPDPKVNFYCQTMDALHFYLFHCFDVGLRTIKTQNDNVDHEIKTNNDEYFDTEFDSINKTILDKKSITKSFERFSTKNSKFSIKKLQNKWNETGTTCLDEMYKHLKTINLDIQQLKEFIIINEYDTTSIEYDIQNDNNNNNMATLNKSTTPVPATPNTTSTSTSTSNTSNTSNTSSMRSSIYMQRNSNIANHINNKICIQEIKQFLEETRVLSLSFNIGLKFYYWQYYASIQQIPYKEEKRYNENDHSGYNISQLFIKQRYETFKEEITNYKYINIKQYANIIIIKVKCYFENTDIVSGGIRAVGGISGIWSGTQGLHYDIEKDSLLTFAHILALVLYTDYNELSSDFRSTFSKNGAFETIQSVKKRNSFYWWMSKLLRECVELYGECRFGDDYADFNNKVLGPFYCGMSSVINITDIILNLCSPTSTSMQMEVAIKCNVDAGIIIELNNPETTQHQWLRDFNLSWISKYKEEDERLFFGGYHRIKIESVRIRSTGQNFQAFIYSLYCLDTMITGGKQDGSGNDMKISRKYIKLINELMNDILNKVKSNAFDPYVYSTFVSFSQNKQEISLDLRELNKANNALKDLFMYGLEERLAVSEHKRKRKKNDLKNLFKSDIIFGIFKNIKTMIIQTTNVTGDRSYSFSIISLLSLIESGLLSKIIVKAVNYRSKYNWINTIWSSSSSKIRKKYNAKRYNISCKEVYKERAEYWLVINKKK